MRKMRRRTINSNASLENLLSCSSSPVGDPSPPHGELRWAARGICRGRRKHMIGPAGGPGLTDQGPCHENVVTGTVATTLSRPRDRAGPCPKNERTGTVASSICAFFITGDWRWCVRIGHERVSRSGMCYSRPRHLHWRHKRTSQLMMRIITCCLYRSSVNKGEKEKKKEKERLRYRGHRCEFGSVLIDDVVRGVIDIGGRAVSDIVVLRHIEREEPENA